MIARLTDDQRRLAESCVKWGWKIAGNYATRFPRLREEIESAALMGVVKGAARFRPERGYKPTTFLTHAIRWEINNLLQAEKRRVKTVPGGEAIDHVIANAPSREWAPETIVELADMQGRRLAPPCPQCGTLEGPLDPESGEPFRCRGLCLDCWRDQPLTLSPSGKTESPEATAKRLERKRIADRNERLRLRAARVAAPCHRCGDAGRGRDKFAGLCKPCQGAWKRDPCSRCQGPLGKGASLGLCRGCYATERDRERREDKGMTDPERMASRARRRLRTMLARRQGWRCKYCRQPMEKIAGSSDRPRGVTLDHAIPRSLGGLDDPSNLVACCYQCNQAKGGLRATEFGEGAA